MSYKNPIAEPIAVVGSSCRFAGGVNATSQLWKLLVNPTDLSRHVPKERFNIDAFYHVDGEYHGTTNSPKAYFLDQDHRVFDSSFFNITPKEAEAIDPQQRMLLEVVYEALEDAGYTLGEYAGKMVAVFAGLMTGDYDTLSQRDELDTSQYYATGNARSILSNRISYYFNFNGPSMTIDTACSSSLVALHQAVLSLRSGECDMACVTGANLILTPEQFIVESNLHMLSPTGHCRMWDAGADGYARGEGVAAIFIKPLSKAIQDGDHIEAIIRETGVNSDGRTRGITMPNWEAQSRLIKDTYQRAGLDSKSPVDRCQYFEAHGTGTSAGDPNEARAIEDAFFGHGNHKTTSHSPSAATDKLLVGSVKTVIGHTEGAAGLAGLLKVVESMRNNSVPPNLHLEKLNPAVEEYYDSLFVPTLATAWPHVPAGQPKRGSVNSFGFGGTNAHAIVEQYIPEVHNIIAKAFRPSLDAPRPALFSGRMKSTQVCLPMVLSAPSQKSLVAVAKTYRDYLLKDSVPRSEEVAWHTSARRTAFPFRASVSSSSVSGLVDKLNSMISKAENSSVVTIGTRARPDNEQPKILGVFTGQGAQWATMSRGLLQTSEVYASTIRALDKILRQCPDPPSWSLEQEIMADEGLSRVKKASVSQPLCTAIQLGLVNLLRHLGISFHAVVGHSSGEIAAAYAAGKISIRDAILISHYRGMGVHLSCGAAGAKGGMLAAGLTKEEAQELCARKEYANRLWIAASNAPSSVTLSGDLDAVEQACAYLTEQRKFARMLFVDTAYHSPHMEGPSVKYLEALNACHISPSADGNGTAWISSVYDLGEPSNDELQACYWKDNMAKPVLFYEAVGTALETLGPFDCAIEVGPHPALKGPVMQTLKEKGENGIPYSGLLDRKLDDREAFAGFLGWMWTQFGSSSSQIRQFVLGSVHPQLVANRLTGAPSYPWDHSQHFYRESRISRQYHFKTEKPHELLGVRTRDDNKHQLRWRNILKLEKLPWVKHHSFQGQALLPASAYLVMALDAARVALAGRPASIVELRNLKFPSGVILEPNAPGVEVLFSLTIERDAQKTIEASFTLTSVVADSNTDMKKNFSGSVSITLGEPTAEALPSRPKDRAETSHADPESFYDMMAGTGLVYTAPFKGLQTLERRYNFSSGTLKKLHSEDTTGLSISPATLDSCLQTAFVTISSPGDNAIWTSFLPLDIDSVRFNLAICDVKNHDDALAVDAYMTKATPITGQTAASFTADIEVFNPRGDMEIQVQGLTVGSFSSTKPEEDYELYLTTKLDVDPDDEIVTAGGLGMQARNPMLIESCERVASFYTSAASIGRPLRSLIPGQADTPMPTNSWPSETEQTLNQFVIASPYFSTLDFIRQLGKNLPDVLAGMLPAVVEETHQLVEFRKHISRVVRQITHKYPRMNVLGLTDPELGVTEHVLAGLDNTFLSYRVGSEPEKNLENSLTLSDSLRKKIMVDKVDLDATEPENGQYDLVILATSLIETQKTASMLRAIHGMMRQGGFLLLIHVSLSPLKNRIRRCAGLGPSSTTPVSPPDWPDFLDQCGFGQSMKNSNQYYQPGFQLIVRQAESENKSLLLHPLTDSRRGLLVDSLLVVGGEQLWASLIASGVCSALTTRCGAVEVVETLDSLDIASVPSYSAAIFLNDIDEPVLATMTGQRMEALRALFKPRMIILWVTQNSRFYNPDHAASFGFTRTLAAETPDLALQVLDLDTIDTAPAVNEITETFARLTMHCLIGNDDENVNKPLWVNEPEVHLQEGRRLVPRVIPWKEGNNRVNAPRRVVSETVNTLEKVVQLVPTQAEDNSSLYEVMIEKVDVVGLSKIQVDYSTVEAVRLGQSNSGYVCIGRNLDTGKTQVALSKSNASYIAIPRSLENIIDNGSFNQPAFLALLARYLAAYTIASMDKGQLVLLIEPDKMFQECVQDIFIRRGVWFQICSTNAARCAATPGMIYLHPGSPLREVKALYPREGAWIIDMSPTKSKLSEILVQSLPGNCQYNQHSALFGSGHLSNHENDNMMESFWKHAIILALSKASNWDSDVAPTMVAVPALIGSNDPIRPFQIIDWKAERSVSQIVKPLAGTRLLNPAKTYVLIGLTRDFGQSLCTLFVQQGARHVVLSSRNPPKVAPKWQTEMLSRGITIRFEALDVTNLERVVAFKSKIAETLPPVGGVVNGAMVLEDRVFSQMSLETLYRVMNPKTVGSKNLDIVFDCADMDFFIMTSSFAAIGGHAGQSNYAAANMYMNGLAASRRRRGLPGSVLNIGVIYGLGFLHREKHDLYKGLEHEGYPPISERDIHHMFVEAIAAGKPVPGQIYDITTGLRRFPFSNKTLHWHNDPRFSHYTRPEEESVGGVAMDGSQKQTLKELMDAAKTSDELVDVLVHGFIARLQSQLHLTEGNVTSDHTIVELGVDSLAAVEVRSWIWKALGQDVAVMKILGGSTIAKLCLEIGAAIMEARAEVGATSATESSRIESQRVPAAPETIASSVSAGSDSGKGSSVASDETAPSQVSEKDE